MILRLWRQRKADLCKFLASLHGKFQASQSYIEEHCLKQRLPDLSYRYHMDRYRLMEDQDEYSENYMLRAVTVGQTTLVAIATDRTGRKGDPQGPWALY